MLCRSPFLRMFTFKLLPIIIIKIKLAIFDCDIGIDTK